MSLKHPEPPETTVRVAASDTRRTASDTAKKVVTTAKMTASAGAKKAGQTVKQAAKLTQRFGPNRKEPQPLRIAVEALSEELKRAYLQTLVWLTFEDDRQIDLREISALHLLMVRLRCDAATRQAVRNAIDDPTCLAPEKLVRRTLELAREEAQRADLGSQVPTRDQETEARRTQGESQQEAVGHSLLKDAIWLRLSTTVDGTWPSRSLTLATSASDHPGIHRLAELVGIDAKQLAVLEEWCIRDKKLLDEQHDEEQIRKIAKELASKAASVGVPIAAVYLSGSVTGLSAAGITSGLAALGLGGVLGLSAMMTGVGTVVIGGVTVYQGSRWIINRGPHARSQRREARMQEVLRVHQKALANLAEDICHLGVRLVGLTEDVEVNRGRIEKLAMKMTLFGKALGQLRKNEVSLEAELRHTRERREAEEDAEEDASSAPSDGPESTGSG